MSAEEKVFSISDLRLYILQYAIEDKKAERNNKCLTSCKERVNYTVDSCLWNIFCCAICCFCTYPSFGFGPSRQ